MSQIGVPRLSYQEKRARTRLQFGENIKGKNVNAQSGMVVRYTRFIQIQNHLLVEQKDTSLFVPDRVYGHNLGRTLEPMPYLVNPAAAIRWVSDISLTTCFLHVIWRAAIQCNQINDSLNLDQAFFVSFQKLKLFSKLKPKNSRFFHSTQCTEGFSAQFSKNGVFNSISNKTSFKICSSIKQLQ